MKLSLLTLIPALLAIGATAVSTPQRSVIVSYPENTPNSVVDQAMNAINDAGGMVTHQYTLFKGFAAQAPAKALDTVQAWGKDWNAVIEEDEIVTTNGGL